MNSHESDALHDPCDAHNDFDPTHTGSVKDFFRKLKRRHDILAEQLEKIMDEMEKLAYYLEKLEDNPAVFVSLLLERSGEAPGSSNGRKLNGYGYGAKRFQHGLHSVRIKPGEEGYDMVMIERQPPFLLPRRLAYLLQVLAEETPVSPDHIVGWKTTAEIASRLNTLAGKRTLPQSVTNLVYRLRKALERCGGLDRRFVEVRRHQGVRFRVRGVKRGPDRF